MNPLRYGHKVQTEIEFNSYFIPVHTRTEGSLDFLKCICCIVIALIISHALLSCITHPYIMHHISFYHACSILVSCIKCPSIMHAILMCTNNNKANIYTGFTLQHSTVINVCPVKLTVNYIEVLRPFYQYSK